MLNLKKILGTVSVIGLGAFSLVSVGHAQYSEGEMQGRMEEKLPTRVSAEKSESIAYMGLTGGANNPVGGIETAAEVGVVAGTQRDMGMGFGGEINTTQLNDTDKNQRTLVLAKADYKFGGDVPVASDSYFGVGAGPAIVDTKVKWAVSPNVGFDIPLTKKAHDTVSLGLNAKYVGVTDSPDSYVGSAAVKYWY